MSHDESEVERRAGADMVPFGESLEWNPERDDGSPILRQDSTSSCPTRSPYRRVPTNTERVAQMNIGG